MREADPAKRFGSSSTVLMYRMYGMPILQEQKIGDTDIAEKAHF